MRKSLPHGRVCTVPTKLPTKHPIKPVLDTPTDAHVPIRRTPQGPSGRKSHHAPTRCLEVTASFALKCKFSIIVLWHWFFDLLSFLNGLSYTCRFRLEWKIIWCSFRNLLVLINILTIITHFTYILYILDMKLCSILNFFMHHIKFKKIMLFLNIVPKTISNYLSFKTNRTFIA